MNKGAPDDTAVRLYLDRWNLRPDGPALRTPSSTLAPVRRDGTPAMLKIAHAAEEQIGNDLMVWWNGRGAAPILAHDDHALLMERALGGQSLERMATQGQDEQASRLLCAALARLHEPHAAPLPKLTPLQSWFRDLLAADPAARPMLERSAQAARRLLDEPQDVGVLHGDMHHGNLLDFGPSGWLAIDPKGLHGERGFDYANLFCNPDPATALVFFHRRLEQVVQAAGLDRRRLLQWILAWSGLSALWLMQDGMDAAGRLDVGRMAARELDLPD